jgi:two-component system, chemotaxis family, CheB/CheR fusion protein
MARKDRAGPATSSKEEKATRQPNQTPEDPKESDPVAAVAVPSLSRREEEGRRPRPSVVGIGASAGGLEALTELLQAMPADSGLAFVVVSHLDPEQKSALSEILARATPMPVREAKGGMAVEPNHVYVIPPDHDMVIARDVLHLVRRVDAPVHLPIDTFLASLAEDRSSQASGVILSGNGSDGTRGLKAIKAEGGITFAQDQTARFHGMPQSAIAAGSVDFVLPPPLIAAELLRIARHPSQSRPEEARPLAASDKEDAFLQIVRLLSAATGVDFLNYKQSTLRRRIERRLVLRRLSTLAEYLQCLRDDPAELQRLSEEVLILVTGFFRDPEVFEALKSTVFPRLMQSRLPDAPLRVWVPGCATGEEAYSLAICLLEYLVDAPNAPQIKIFATDISERAIEVARAGVYGEGIPAEVSAQRLHQFFVKTNRGYEISRAVRELCIFARQDVTKDPPFSQLDLISCRNVLIYLGQVLQSQVLPIFHYALKPGGFLVLGNSETVGSFTDLFQELDKRFKFYVRTATPSRLTFDYTPGAPTRTQVVVREAGPPAGRGAPDLFREADRLVLAHYAPPGVVVDENLRVLQFRGDTGNYLKPAPGAPTADLLLLARDGLLGDLRAVLDRAKRDNAPARKDGVRVKSNDHFREIDIVVIPTADLAPGIRHFVILFEEARAAAAAGAAAPRARVPLTPEEESAKDRELGLLQHELETTKAYLQSVIEHEEGANEELRAANEEIISANEELQSTNEELQTAKEELQATNEELTTVNDELRSRIRTADELSDDLVNLIDATNIPIVVLGADLCIRRFTPRAHRALNLLPGDVGRPIGDLKLKINVSDLESLAREVIDTLEIKQREVRDDVGSWHKLYIRPYKTLDQKIGGVVLMLIDIDALKRREQQIEESRDYAVSIVETVREPLIVLDGRLRVRTANRAFYQTFQVNPKETEGRLIYELGDRLWDIPQLRTFLEELLPQNSHFEDFEVEHDFPGIGRRTMLLNAHRVVQLEGEPSHLILMAIEDITARRQAEHLRQESQDRLQTIVNTAVDAIITADERGTIASVNPAAERMFGYTAAEMLGQNVKMLMPSPHREEHDGYLGRYVRTGEKHIIGVGREVRGRRKDGSTFPVDLSVSEYQDRTERFFSGVLRDLSVRKALEQEVLEAATMEQWRIGQELHDSTGQELTALGLLAEGLVEALTKTSPGEAVLATKVAEGLKRVLRQVRALSRGLIPVEVDAAGLMAALAELASRTSDLHGVTCTFECRQPVLVEDNQTATHLYGIAKEAVANALKHSGAKSILIILESDEHSIALRVQDDGVGLPAEPVESKGMGLKIMRYRAGLINAGLTVGPAEPGGTLVSCTISKGTGDGQERKPAE